MCVCVNPRLSGPVACDGVEAECDVQILVGDPGWQFSASKSALAAASPVFEAMFFGPLATKDDYIVIRDVDQRAFEILLGYVSGSPPEIKSATTALHTLYAAHRYLMSGLVRYCTEFLDKSLQPETAIEVFSHARVYTPYIQHPSTPRGSPDQQPSAPPENDEPLKPPGIVGWSAVLLSRCFDFIDKHGDAVLVQEAIEDLSKEALEEIICRDTLQCQEIVVFQALERWSERECRRQCLSPSPDNRRKVLGSLLFLVRFPLLTAEEFLAGPIQSGILSQQEIAFFSALLTKSKLPLTPKELVPRLNKMATPRNAKEPVIVTKDVKSTKVKEKNGKRWFRRKDKSENGGNSNCTKECCCQCLLDMLIWCFD